MLASSCAAPVHATDRNIDTNSQSLWPNAQAASSKIKEKTMSHLHWFSPHQEEVAKLCVGCTDRILVIRVLLGEDLTLNPVRGLPRLTVRLLYPRSVHLTVIGSSTIHDCTSHVRLSQVAAQLQ